ncbi:MAG: FAD-binding oxidoreductase [Bacteroidetes bacterium]|nr:FAD-binding oxidoreductase [Bacteroidota bacterium]
MHKNWWKWGDSEHYEHVDNYPNLVQICRDHFDMEPVGDFHPPTSFNIPEVSEEDQQQMRNAFSGLPDDRLTFANTTRLEKALGKSYHDVIRIFKDHELIAPDVVLFPHNHEEVQTAVNAAHENNIVLAAVGGGSNVAGALTLEEKEKRKVAYMDMSHMSQLLHLDEENRLATFQAGVMGPHLEEQLKPYGLTLGHFPQSFEFSSLGGWVVTRSAGQESTYYGKIEDMVVSLKVATPVGTIGTPKFDRDAEGINITPLFLGSEGLLGVVTEVTIRLHPTPTKNRWVLALFPTYEDGAKCLKEIIHEDIYPSICRLSDAPETYFYGQLKPSKSGWTESLKSIVQNAYLKYKNVSEPNIMMLRFEEVRVSSLGDSLRAKRIISKHKGAMIPASLAKNWEDTRFHTPYLRDTMMEHRIFVDTMETVVPWEKVLPMHEAVNANLRNCEAFHKDKGIIMSHISHIYAHGACMYFILICPMNKGSEVEQWEAIKKVVNDSFYDNGGAASHHHSVGLDHQEHYLKHQDPIAIEMLQLMKSKLDPKGVLNPGKLFDVQKR